MDWILKNKNKRRKTLLIVLFFGMLFSFVFAKNASASTFCQCYNLAEDNITMSNHIEITDAAAIASSGACSSECSKRNFTKSALRTSLIDRAATSMWETIKSAISAPFVGAIKLLLIGILQICGWLFALAATIFAWTIDPVNISGNQGILNNQVVKDIWIMVRDVLNMMFILILLFSAFCTIFQVEKWNLKKVWLNILINALLVNFSFAIARFIMDISNVMMYYFLNNMFSSTGTVNGTSILSGFSAASHIGDILAPKSFSDYDIAYLIAMIIFVFIFGMTLLIIAALFVVRLAALTMIAMFAPIGFVGYIFPETKGFADQWWKQLFSYSFFAPIMVFVMAVSLRIIEAIGRDNFQTFEANALQNAPDDQSKWIAQAAFFSIPIIILWMGMGIAKSMGIAGAEAVVGAAQKFSKWAGSLPFKLGMLGAKKFERDVLAPRGLSPRAFIQGWKTRTEDAEKKALKPAAGAWRDKLNSVFSLGKEKTHYADMERELLINEEVKEMKAYATDASYILDEVDDITKTGKKDAKSQIKVEAALRMLYGNNDQNDFTKHYGEARTPENTRKRAAALLRKVGLSESRVGKNLYQLGEIALSNGNHADYGGGTYDNAIKDYRESTDDEHLFAAVAKFKNLGSQEKMKSGHWNAMRTENIDGTPGEIHRFGQAYLNIISGAEADQANRSRLDMITNMYELDKGKAIQDLINRGEAPVPKIVNGKVVVTMEKIKDKQKEVIDYYLQKLEEGYVGKDLDKIKGKSAKDKKQEKPKEEKSKEKDRTLTFQDSYNMFGNQE